ncbi:MAG: putative gamma-glutamyltransferase YwrD [Alphaproteobacteria bacterium MarineAlpha9_Bin2]|nr:MAG: putative gamma-glutamyltransferase YwrD [Alphaproteobacteria bacterium MarineAlpha9_Bin2]
MRDTHFPGRSPVYSMNGMAATSHPLATKSATDLLSAGGNAIDAAISAAAVLAVVESHSTGIGGDLFCLYRPSESKNIIALNASGKSPDALSIDKLDELGIRDNIPFESPHAVSIPLGVAGWVKLIEDHGTLSIKQILKPAIEYAEKGYVVADIIGDYWEREFEKLSIDNDCKKIFLPSGKSLKCGEIHYQPKLAETLGRIAEEGGTGFYEGFVAEDMVKKLRSLGGFHTLEDFASATADYVDPISASYRDVEVFECPPNGQGLIALIILKILEGFDFNKMDPNSSSRIHLQAEATKIAFSHRNDYLADPDFAYIPIDECLSEEYIEKLRSLIKLESCIENSYQPVIPLHSDTVYITVVDKNRNAVSLINSIFHSFGSGIVAPGSGVLFQNRGASFVLDPEHPNSLVGGKRPMHTIIPAMVMRDQMPFLSFGVMGGHYQPTGQAHVLSNIVDYKMNPQESLDFPRSFFFDGMLQCERGVSQGTRNELKKIGHDVEVCDLPHGGGQVIQFSSKGSVLIGGSDHRRDGSALGL